MDAGLTPRLAEAQEGKRHVFFVEAAHFVRGAWVGYMWCTARVLLPTPCGRQPLNVLGALHAISHQIIAVVNETCFSSETSLPLSSRTIRSLWSWRTRAISGTTMVWQRRNALGSHSCGYQRIPLS